MKTIMIFFATCFSIISFGQYALPKVTTTQQQAVRDNARGITNEKWFITKTERYTYYGIIFKNTPVGLKHAFEKYYSMRLEYKTDDCENNSLIASHALNEDKSYNYQSLANSINAGSSELSFLCEVTDKKIDALKFNSLSPPDAMIVLYVLVGN